MERKYRRSAQSPARARRARGLLFNEHIVYPWPRRTRDVFFGEIPKLPPGVSEIFAHPVLDGEDLRAYDTENADILLDQHNIRRISFRELRNLQRAG